MHFKQKQDDITGHFSCARLLFHVHCRLYQLSKFHLTEQWLHLLILWQTKWSLISAIKIASGGPMQLLKLALRMVTGCSYWNWTNSDWLELSKLRQSKWWLVVTQPIIYPHFHRSHWLTALLLNLWIKNALAFIQVLFVLDQVNVLRYVVLQIA